MKIGTITAPYSGNNVNITQGRIQGIPMNCAFVVQASATSVVSGKVAIWDLSAINEIVKLPVYTDITTAGTETIVNKNRNALVAIQEGTDELHNTHITTINGAIVTTIKLNNCEMEMPVIINTSASAPALCIDAKSGSANQGSLLWDDPTNDGSNKFIQLSDVKVTGLNATKSIVRFICF